MPLTLTLSPLARGEGTRAALPRPACGERAGVRGFLRGEGRAAAFGGPGLGDAAALSVSAAQLVAAHPRAAVLADFADADLGVHEPVPLQQQQLCFPRLWRAARCGHAVGCAV